MPKYSKPGRPVQSDKRTHTPRVTIRKSIQDEMRVIAKRSNISLSSHYEAALTLYIAASSVDNK